ncbi:restriction endonuclease subunit S [Streptomyces phaeochromogenes]|uniref:restriction endonuclease subunit S n=1 Tax=Streptomyces phaeochromogenes TaxID=1923 RepID=UPI003407C3DA
MSSALTQSARVVDWLTNVRPGWPTTTLGRVGRFHMGTTFPHAYQGVTQGDLPFIKVSDFPRADHLGVLSGANNWVDRQTARQLGARIVPRGSILYARVGAALLLNQRCITGRTCIVDDNVRAFEPEHGDPRYWRYLMLLLDMAKITNPGPVPSVSERQVAALPVPLPTVEEQRRIADFLDAEIKKLARIELLSSKVSCLLGERQASLLSNCFSSRTTEADGALPVNLALRRVVNRWIDYRGATPEKTVSGVPLVTAKNIRDGKIDMAASREYIAEDAYSDWMRRGLLMRGDVLLTTEAPLGQVAMVDDPGVALAQRVIVLRADQRFCSPEWLYWYLRSPHGQAELELRATGSTALGIKADRLRGVPIPVFKPAEAKERLAQLQSQVSQIESLQGELSRQRALIAERRQALITAAVTGQFDVSTTSGRHVTDGVTA